MGGEDIERGTIQRCGIGTVILGDVQEGVEAAERIGQRG